MNKPVNNPSSPVSAAPPADNPMRNPGDEAAPGTPQTGEVTCPECHGSGKTSEQQICMQCGGTGMIVVTVGDA